LVEADLRTLLDETRAAAATITSAQTAGG
jgi:hypothetical protein